VNEPDTMDRLALRQHIVEWLDKKREQFLKAAQVANIPPWIHITTPVVTDITDTSYHSEEQIFKVSPLANPVYAYHLQEIVKTASDIPESPASRLYEAFGDRCRVWSPTQQQNFGENIARWIDTVLLSSLATIYLQKRSSLETGDGPLAEAWRKT
jgi:hypothetical protein